MAQSVTHTFFNVVILGPNNNFKLSVLRSKGGNKTGGVFYCCKGKIPCNGLVIEGIVKIVFVSIGMYATSSNPDFTFQNSIFWNWINLFALLFD